VKHPDWLWTVCTYCFSTSVQSVISDLNILTTRNFLTSPTRWNILIDFELSALTAFQHPCSQSRSTKHPGYWAFLTSASRGFRFSTSRLEDCSIFKVQRASYLDRNPFANNPSLTVSIHWFNEFHILRLVIQHQLVRSWTPPPTESRPWLTTPNSSTGKVSTFHSPTFVFVQSRVFSIAGGRRALTSAIPHEASTLARHWPVPSYQLPLSMSDSEFTSAL